VHQASRAAVQRSADRRRFCQAFWYLNNDYYAEVVKHFYSGPQSLRGEYVE